MRRTRASLHTALLDLAHEKPYPSIAVKEILARADVGRSTFYGHFRNKDDLLRNGIADLLDRLAERRGPGGAPADLLAFSLPILRHIDTYRRAEGLTLARGSRRIIHQHLGRVIGEDLAHVLAEPTPTAAGMPSALVAQHLASTFVLVLNWWIDHDPELTPEAVDARFRTLVNPLAVKLRPARARDASTGRDLKRG